MRARDFFLILLLASGLLSVGFGFATYKSLSYLSSAAESDDGEASSLGDADIAKLTIDGVIMDSELWLKELKKLEKDDSPKGLLIRVNSPGGAVGPSQEVFERLMVLRKTKKIYCSFGDVAASGGYYIGAACEKIISNAGTLTGSLGVIMPFMNLEGLLKWARVSPFDMHAGKFKDIGSSYRPMREDERALIQNLLDSVHGQFKEAVSRGRPTLKKEIIEEYADGRILLGSQAKKLGFVDELGGEDIAVQMLAKELGITKEPKIFKLGEEKAWEKLLEGQTSRAHNMPLGFFSFVMQALMGGHARAIPAAQSINNIQTWAKPGIPYLLMNSFVE